MSESPCGTRDFAAIGRFIAEKYVRDTIPASGKAYLQLFQDCDRFNDDSLRHVLIEDIFLFLHLLDRVLAHKIQIEERTVVMDSAVQSALMNIARNIKFIDENEAESFASWFAQKYNERQSEYAAYGFENPTGSTRDTLIWEFAKRIEHEVGDDDPTRIIALNMVGISLLKFAYGCSEQFF